MISVTAALSIRDPLPCVCPPQAAASGSMLLSVSKMLGEGMAMAEKMLEKAAGELGLAELEEKVRLRFRLLRNSHARCAPSTICSNEFDSVVYLLLRPYTLATELSLFGRLHACRSTINDIACSYYTTLSCRRFQSNCAWWTLLKRSILRR